MKLIKKLIVIAGSAIFMSSCTLSDDRYEMFHWPGASPLDIKSGNYSAFYGSSIENIKRQPEFDIVINQWSLIATVFFYRLVLGSEYVDNKDLAQKKADSLSFRFGGIILGSPGLNSFSAQINSDTYVVSMGRRIKGMDTPFYVFVSKTKQQQFIVGIPEYDQEMVDFLRSENIACELNENWTMSEMTKSALGYGWTKADKKLIERFEASFKHSLLMLKGLKDEDAIRVFQKIHEYSREKGKYKSFIFYTKDEIYPEWFENFVTSLFRDKVLGVFRPKR